MTTTDKAMVTDEVIEEIARAWASIDGKREQFDDCKSDAALEDEFGHYEGYMAEARELVRRSPALNAALSTLSERGEEEERSAPAPESHTMGLHWQDVADAWPMEGMRDIEAVTDIGTYTISADQPAAGGTHYLWLAGNETDQHDSEHRMSRDAEAAAEADYRTRRGAKEVQDRG